MIMPQTLRFAAGERIFRVEVSQERYDGEQLMQRLTVYDDTPGLPNNKIAEQLRIEAALPSEGEQR